MLIEAAPSAQLVVDLLLSLKKNDEDAIEAILRRASKESLPENFAALLRMSIFHTGASAKYYRKIRNVWLQSGRPQLKAARTEISIEILSDSTIDTLAPHLEMFLAAYGIAANISIAAYDSVEHEAFSVGLKRFDVTVILLSESWIRRHVPVVPADASVVNAAKGALEQIIVALSDKRSGRLVFTNFAQGSWPPVGGAVERGLQVSWLALLGRLNEALYSVSSERVLVADAQTALHLSGGVLASGRISKVRMRAPFEEIGFIGVAREIASILASAFGRSHRALLTDWDNTLWGGEVGELGFTGVQCGPETPDGYGYYLLQSYIRDLSALGVLVAAVSRNDPAMSGILDSNPHLALRRENFSSLVLSWGNKSESVSRVASELNFGTDLMLYVDDNHVDLAEVLLAHPQVDVVLAGPDPDLTLNRLVLARFFNTASFTEGDLNRTQRAVALREQRDSASGFASKEEFLASLDIDVVVSGLKPDNRERVLQLLQKTNQFNLTTRRHGGSELDALIGGGAKIGVFDYKDRFGPQGIIGLMILTGFESKTGIEIDTWLMSCRVLNRGVEEIMLGWAEEASTGQPLLGRYIATAKNALVRDLYPRLGFEEINPGSMQYLKSTNGKS
jgi:FkbH-like protein